MCNTVTVNLHKFIQLYAAVSTPMKQRKHVVGRVRVRHRLFPSSRKRQSQETGFYTVTASLEIPVSNGFYVTLGSIAGFLEMLYQNINRSGGKRGRTYHINLKCAL